MSKSPVAEPAWADEWVPLKEIILHDPWQVRDRLDERVIKRYADMTRAGSVPPPILVGRIGGKLYLLDGWHRVTAGALQENSLEGLVLARVASLNKNQARWIAAKANLGHGLQLKTKEFRAVFQAFIKAKQNIKADGSLMSYREIAPHIGKPHTTVRTWMLKDFPTTAKRMGGDEHGDPQAEKPELPDAREEHLAVCMEAVLNVTQRVDILTPEGRWKVAQEMEVTLALLRQHGLQKPAPEDF